MEKASAAGCCFIPRYDLIDKGMGYGIFIGVNLTGLDKGNILQDL